MQITTQDKHDWSELFLALGLFFVVMYTICFVLSEALAIRMDHARHLVAAVTTVLALAYVAREVLPLYRRLFLSITGVILLIGAYGAASEMYIRHFTTLGMGELPELFTYFYVAFTTAITAGVIYFIKRDLFYR